MTISKLDILMIILALCLSLCGFYLVNVYDDSHSFVLTELPAQTSEILSTGDGEAVSSETGIININTAGPIDLQRLPDIGETLALNIIEYRETNGGFQNIYELMNVYGIGQNIFMNLADLVCVY